MSSEQPTCCGCAIRGDWLATLDLFPQIPNPFNTIPYHCKFPELTDDEKEVLGYLAAAWNKFTKLDQKHPDHNNEFKDAIHRAQYIIGVRVARRINPEIWYVPQEDTLEKS